MYIEICKFSSETKDEKNCKNLKFFAKNITNFFLGCSKALNNSIVIKTS